jgi:hypothetical protein
MDKAMSAILPWGKLPLSNMWGGVFSDHKIFIKNFLENICDVRKVVTFVCAILWAVSAYA